MTINKFFIYLRSSIWSVCIFILLIVSLTACNKHPTITLPGYVEGKYIYISSNFTGVLKSLYVTPGEEVKINQPLFSLEALPEYADLLAANARVQEAENLKNKAQENYNLQDTQMTRNNYLLKRDVISRAEFDSSNTTYRQAFAELKAAEENLNAKKADQSKAQWMARQKVVNAPIASAVFDIYYSIGELVSSDIPVLSLLAPSQIKVIFFVYEPILSTIKLNQVVDVRCDNCKKSFKAKITYISNKAEYTPPVIYSNEERAKLVYRIEALPLVKTVLYDVHPGQPVTVTMTF